MKKWPDTWVAIFDPIMSESKRWVVYADGLPSGRRMPAECTGTDAERNAKLIALAPTMLALLLELFESGWRPEDLHKFCQYHKIDRRWVEKALPVLKLGFTLTREAP